MRKRPIAAERLVEIEGDSLVRNRYERLIRSLAKLRVEKQERGRLTNVTQQRCDYSPRPSEHTGPVDKTCTAAKTRGEGLEGQ